MTNRYLRFTGLTLVALAFMAIQNFEPSQAQHSATDTYAITNARIVPVTGPTIDKGTIVIRDGLIAEGRFVIFRSTPGCPPLSDCQRKKP